jgi:hypothetical protein
VVFASMLMRLVRRRFRTWGQTPGQRAAIR